MRTIIRNNYDPKTSDYHETLVIDDALEKKYLFDCDGVFTDVTNPKVVSESGNHENYAASQKWVTEIEGDLADEIQNRTDADGAIWEEIESIEAASDVVDVVGTYAELEAYDTSKLHDNDLIKVLQDETHDDVIAYYRWSTSTDTFSYVGAEGPYYTESQIDTMMSGKQDTLIAGSNIQIASDGKTISATDTTYSPFVGATSSVAGSAGLVPAPTISDPEKFLKGDGTWGEVPTVTTFYTDTFEGSQVYLYKNEMETIKATFAEVADALGKGPVRIVSEDAGAGQVIYVREYWDDLPSGTLELLIDDNLLFSNESVLLSVVNSAQPSADALFHVDVIPNYTLPTASSNTLGGIKVGSNLSITSGILSAKTMVGATSNLNGAEGYVPQPLIADKDKFLKGDGTWADAGGTKVYLVSNPSNISLSDPSVTSVTLSNGTWADVAYDVSTGKDVQIYHSVSPSGEALYDYYDVVQVKEVVYPTPQSYTIVLVGTDGSIIKVSGTGATGTVAHTVIPVLYGTTGQNTDGAVTQKYFTQVVGDIETILQILNHGSGVTPPTP